MNKPIIKFRDTLFWDTNPKNLDAQKHAKYIIERIMDFGNDEEVRWMRSFYSKGQQKEVARNSKVLLPASRNLWKLLLRV